MRLDSQFLHHFMCFYLFLIFLISSWNASLLSEYSILHAALCVWAQSLFGLVPNFVPPRSQISPGQFLSCPWRSSEWSLRSNYQITPRVTAYQDSLLFSNHNLKFCCVHFFVFTFIKMHHVHCDNLIKPFSLHSTGNLLPYLLPCQFLCHLHTLLAQML